MAKQKETSKWVQSDPLEGPAILAAVKGDQDSFTFLYHLHKEKIYNYCLGMIKDSSLAEEFTQDVFVQMYYKLHTFKFEASLSTWLYRVASNIIGQYFRRYNRTRKIMTPLEECVDSGGDLTIEYGATDPNLDMLLARVAIDRAIEEVGEEKLQPFLLYEQGHGWKDQTGYSKDSYTAIKSRGLRAKWKLRKALERQLTTV